MLYYIERLEWIDEVLEEALLPYLSQERIDQKNRYRFRSDRIQSIVAYILLRIGLLQEYGVTQLPRIGISETKKPFLITPAGVHFNLSHCKKSVACGIDIAPLGVDVQDYVPYNPSLAKQFMTPYEIETIEKTSEAFTKLWTLKESYGKYLGSGICYPMTEQVLCEGVLKDGRICQSHLLNDFVLSAVASRELPLVRIRVHELLSLCRFLQKR